jgi:hypothetical protein
MINEAHPEVNSFVYFTSEPIQKIRIKCATYRYDLQEIVGKVQLKQEFRFLEHNAT